jgi:hypothetical protein
MNCRFGIGTCGKGKGGGGATRRASLLLPSPLQASLDLMQPPPEYQWLIYYGINVNACCDWETLQTIKSVRRTLAGVTPFYPAGILVIRPAARIGYWNENSF